MWGHRSDSNGFHIRFSAPRTIEKMKILWAVLELPAKQHSQSGAQPIQPIYPQNWAKLAKSAVLLIAGSSKTAPRILIFSIAIGADFLIWAEFHWDLSPQIFWTYQFIFRLCVKWWAHPIVSCPICHSALTSPWILQATNHIFRLATPHHSPTWSALKIIFYKSKLFLLKNITHRTAQLL